MTSLWLQSSIRYDKFIDFGLLSSIKKKKFVDFGLYSKFNNGVYSSFYIESEFFNFNGDLSISSSFEKTAIGDFPFVSRYTKGVYTSSTYTRSSFLEKKFTSMSFVSTLSMTKAVDFDIVSIFSRSIFAENIIESFVEKKSYIDFGIRDSISFSGKIHQVSFSFGSSFRFPNPALPPIRLYLQDILWPQVFSIDVLSTSVSGITADVGYFSLVFDKRLLGVTQGAGKFSIENLELLGSVYANAGTIQVLNKKSLSGLLSNEIELEMSESRLDDLLSAQISFVFSRIIYDFEEGIGDHLTIPMLYKKLDVRQFSAEISIPFSDILNRISDSRMYALMAMPKKNTIIENPVSMSDSITMFRVDKRPSKYIVSGFENNGIYTKLNIRNNLAVTGMVNTGITLPHSVLTSVGIGEESHFVDFIGLTNKQIAISSIFEPHASSFLGEVYYNEEHVVASANTPKSKSSEITLIVVKGIEITPAILPPGTEQCISNGRSALMNSNRYTLDINIKTDENKNGVFEYIDKKIEEVDSSIYGLCKLSYNPKIDTIDVYANMSLSVSIFEHIDTDDVYYNLRPIIFSSSAFPDLYYPAHFSMDTKEDLGGLLSGESNLKANMFYNGDDLLSGKIILTVFNYE